VPVNPALSMMSAVFKMILTSLYFYRKNERPAYKKEKYIEYIESSWTSGTIMDKNPQSVQDVQDVQDTFYSFIFSLSEHDKNKNI